MPPRSDCTNFEIPHALRRVLWDCETFCVGACCGRDAFDFSPETVGHSVRTLPPDMLLAARPQLDQLISALEAIPGPVDTITIKDEWSGPAAAGWFSEFRQALDAAADALAATDLRWPGILRGYSRLAASWPAEASGVDLIEFQAVQEEVYERLKFGKYIECHDATPVGQFLILPAYGNAMSWDVVLTSDHSNGNHYRLYRSCWRMDTDERAMRSSVERSQPRPRFKPTMEVDWALLDQRRIGSILDQLGSIRVPLAPESKRHGVDGVTYELSVGEFYRNARICWWRELPEEWQELQPVVNALLRLFEQTWAASRRQP